MSAISGNAPAKINLYLHVTGKAPNGYHLLDSLVVFADVHDVIEMTPSPTLSLRVAGEYAAQIPVEGNIVLKAATAFAHAFNVQAGADIALRKHLPVGAGIGGGSADAAATLKLLARLWKINAPHHALQELALSLGADVPACLQSASLYMGGIGETIDPAPRPPGLHLLLVGSGTPLMTKNVFAAFNGEYSQAAPRRRQFVSADECIFFLKKTRNDLEHAATHLMPEIADILYNISAQRDCLLSRMSGSGSTCFGLFAKRKYAEEAAVRISARNPDWWVKVAGIL